MGENCFDENMPASDLTEEKCCEKRCCWEDAITSSTTEPHQGRCYRNIEPCEQTWDCDPNQPKENCFERENITSTSDFTKDNCCKMGCCWDMDIAQQDEKNACY